MGGRLSRTLAVAANTFRETVRERVLYNLVFFAILLTLAGLLLGQLSIRQDEKIITDIGLAAMDLFGTLIALFVGVGLVAKEVERRSISLLTSPVPMKTAIMVPNRSMAARPMSLRIFSSWRTESWPSSRPASVSRIAKNTRL